MDRGRIMRALALAKPARLIELMGGLGELPSFEYLREPQKGLVMVRGCADARYEPFNLGEALVTRCSIALGEFQGHAYVLGDEPEKCLAAALADALAQDCRYLEGVEHLVLALEDDLARERETELKKTRATRVDFFTLVRGEDAS